MHVLLVDDDRKVLNLLAGKLRTWNHDVTAVRDGMEALKALARDPSITAAILNWMMPGLDGWRVSRAIKASKFREVHTIVTLGSHFCREAKDRFPSWADEYISKPFDLQGLETRLAALDQTLPFPAAGAQPLSPRGLYRNDQERATMAAPEA